MRNILIALSLILSLTTGATAATYYVSPEGSGSTCSTSSRCSLTTGIGLMASGDTLILGDGTYNQRLTGVPSGVSGAYTYIRSEHDGGAIISDSTESTAVFYTYGIHHVQVEGLKFESTATSGGLSGALFLDGASHHNKFLRCAFVVTPCPTGQGACSNRANITISGNYNLIEDSWVWGGGRYKLIFYGGDSSDDTTGSYNIARRVVIRHDREYSGGFNPQSAFANYQGYNNVFQNVISIDSDQTAYYDNPGVWKGPFWLEKGQKGGTVNITGSMVLHYGKYDSPAIFDNCASTNHGQAAYECGEVNVSNFVAIDGGGGLLGGETGYPVARPLIMDHSLIANTLSTGAGNYAYMGAGFSGGASATAQSTSSISTNNVFYGIQRDVFGGNALNYVQGANNYNAFYSNYANRNSSTTGANDVTVVNPLAASILYPLQIQSGSPLKGAGSSGSDIGPTILKKIGASGTLYGETGWNTLTDENLWPWPYEARIKTDMSYYPTGWPVDGLPNPVRGFTSGTSMDGTPQNLTKYIWESLGNQIPSSVYGTSDCTYYVRPDGNDSNTGASNTSGGAWLTIPSSTSESTTHPLAAGDVVCVADGTYDGFHLRAGGSAGNPVVIRAIGTGANITTGNDRNDGITIEGYGSPSYADYVIVDGFNIYNQTRHGVYVATSTDVIVRNCTIHNNAANGMLTGNAPNFSAINNTIYSNGTTSLQHNLYISNAESDNPVVMGNRIYSANFGNGLQLNGDWELGGDGYIDNAIIENNLIYSNAQKGMSLISVRYGTIRNNITYSNGTSAGGIHLVDQLGSHFSVGNTVVNNTLDEPNIACVRVNSGSTDNVIFNNICIGATGIVFEGTGNYQGNNYSASSGGSSIFTGYASHNYTLLATSPAVGYGTASYQSRSAPTIDYLGNARPSGSGYDVGAYEYQEVSAVGMPIGAGSMPIGAGSMPISVQ